MSGFLHRLRKRNSIGGQIGGSGGKQGMLENSCLEHPSDGKTADS